MPRRASFKTPEPRRALPFVHCTAIEERVQTLTTNLKGLVPDFPLTADEIERFYQPEDVLRAVHYAKAYFPESVSGTYCGTLKYERGDRPWRVSIQLTKGSYRVSPDKWFVAEAGIPTDFRPPADLVEKVHDYLRVRYKVGVEIGITRKIVKDTLDRLSSPQQVMKVWPELLRYSAGVNDKLDDKIKRLDALSRTKAVRPEWWDSKWEAAKEMATLALTKAAVLPKFEQDKLKYIVSYAGPGTVRDQDHQVLAPWDGRPIPIV